MAALCRSAAETAGRRRVPATGGGDMELLARLVRGIDRLNDAIGRAVSWLTLAMVFTTFFVVVARYGFSWGQIWIQESYVWMHGAVFMLAAAYTLLHDGHVRVDIFYRPASDRFKAWVNLFGAAFLLLPTVLVVLLYAFPYVQASWIRLEMSREAGGLQGLFLFKTIIPIFCVLMILQGLALAGRSLLVLRRHPGFSIDAAAEARG
jgi:TRAP-type mannitol/chloroaromatic compound transport system permease small subunit